MSWLFLLLVLAAVAAVVYLVRQRHRAQREAEHERAQAFLMALNGVGGAGQPVSSTGAGRGAAAAVPVTEVAQEAAVAPASCAEDAPGPSYLERRHQVVWRWLRAGLPECEIFARGSLRRIVGREQLDKDMMLDFVVCNADFEVLAAIDLEKGNRSDAAGAFKRRQLAGVGVRYACWNPAELPTQEALVAWVGATVEGARPDQSAR
jgi:hypothetical protein